MRKLPRVGLCFALSCWGCAAPPSRIADQAVIPETRQPAPLSPTAPVTPAAGRQTPLAATSVTAESARFPERGPIPADAFHSPSQEQAAALDATIAELRTLGAIDPAAEEQLRADLRQTDPALWPRLLQYFRASPARQTRDQTGVAGLGSQLSPGGLRSTGSSPVKPATAVTGPVPVETPIAAALTWKENPPGPLPEAAHETSPPPDAKEPKPASAPAEIAVPAAKPQETPKPDSQTTAAPAPAGPDSPESNSAGSDVEKANFEQPQPVRSWQDHLQAAIRALEGESSAPPKTTAEIARHADLRLMYLAAGRRDDALRPIAGISPAQQDFWSKELYGLATYLDGERIADSAQRAAAAKDHLNEAVSRLGELGTLTVRNLAFCTKVSSYGVFTRFESDAFSPGQEVLLYAEVENFKSEPTDQGYHTVLRSSYQILDSRGQRVDQRDFSTTEEHCLNPRRDFFIRYFLHMPQRIYDGKYTLQLTIEDTLSQKIGQSSIEFTVKGAQE